MTFWNECAGFINTVGFPVFVAVYMMVVTNKGIKAMTSAFNELTKAVRDHTMTEHTTHRGHDDTQN